MGLYGIYFATLALFNAGVAHYCQRKKEPGRPGAETVALPSGAAGKQEAQKFRLAYFGVYTCVMAADWLQVCKACPKQLQSLTIEREGTIHVYSLQGREVTFRDCSRSAVYNRLYLRRNICLLRGVIGRSMWTKSGMLDILHRLLRFLPVSLE